jgi:YegS/Rv2252/BmrU family lipid kinase
MAERAKGSAAVILNAGAGAGNPQEQASSIENKLRERGLTAHAILLDHGDDLAARVARAVDGGASMVIGGGGDGTLSTIAGQLAGTGVPLGVLPLGTLNHFAKDLGIPLELDPALDVIAQGHSTEVDVGEVNGKVFINNSSLGLYPEVVRDREMQQHRLGRGKWAALLAASVHACRRYPVLSVQMEVDGKSYQRRSSFVFVGNNEYQMEGFGIGERARLSDGKLSLYVTQRTGRFGLLRLALRALVGRLRQARDFDMLTAHDLVVHTRHRRMRVATDGEVAWMETPLNYRVRPGALRVLVPNAASTTEERLS